MVWRWEDLGAFLPKALAKSSNQCRTSCGFKNSKKVLSSDSNIPDASNILVGQILHMARQTVVFGSKRPKRLVNQQSSTHRERVEKHSVSYTNKLPHIQWRSGCFGQDGKDCKSGWKLAIGLNATQARQSFSDRELKRKSDNFWALQQFRNDSRCLINRFGATKTFLKIVHTTWYNNKVIFGTESDVAT
jgi:hypothetical protein